MNIYSLYCYFLVKLYILYQLVDKYSSRTSVLLKGIFFIPILLPLQIKFNFFLYLTKNNK